MIQESIANGVTDLLVINERLKKPYTLTMIHLPNGPTAYFKLSNLKGSKRIQNHGTATEHPPELILNHFDTSLGITIGRFLMSLFPQSPQFTGRQVVTFHHQRDFIFFRRHR
jgi:ribosome production factor 1